MFENRLSSGKHLIADIKGIKNEKLLNSTTMLKAMLRRICKENSFEILNEIEHEFEPVGCSIIFLLSESHISVHSFPEKFHISLDLYSCRSYEKDSEYLVILKDLLKELDASEDSSFKIVDRYF